MSYDPDLSPIIAKASNEDLDPLVQYMLKANTNFLEISDNYKLHEPDHSKYKDLIEKEMRLFGGNSFVNLFRETGPSYLEIAGDVADKLDASYSKGSNAEEIEIAIIMKVANQAYEKMDPEQKRKFLNDLGIGTGLTSLPASLPAIALQLAIKGTGFFAYRMAVIIANAVSKFILGHGLRFATNAALTRGVSVFAGPIGWVITGIWTMVDLAGPAYRVTIPCVAHVAMLRQKSKLTACPACNAPYVGEVNFCPNCGAPL